MQTLSIVLSLLFISTAALASNPDNFTEWKDQARSKYLMTEEQIAECETHIKSADDWGQFKRANFSITPTLNSRNAVVAAVEDEVKRLSEEAFACQKDCERLDARVCELFAAPMTHPSGLNFADFKTAVLQASTRKLSIRKETSQDEANIYKLPHSNYPQENARRALISKAAKQLRMDLAPGKSMIDQFWRINRLDIIFSTIAKKTLNKLVPRLIGQGTAGPYITDCCEVWESYERRQGLLRMHLQFAFQMENELVCWLYNSLDSEEPITDEDYIFFSEYWGHQLEIEEFDGVAKVTSIVFTKSGEYMKLLRSFCLLRQTVLLYEIYLRGFLPQDFDELINHEVDLPTPSWLNILSLAIDYSKKRGTLNGIHYYPHPDLMRQSVERCIDVYLVKQVHTLGRLVDSEPEVHKLPHDEAELKPKFISAMRTNLIGLSESCINIRIRLENQLKKLFPDNQPSIELVTSPIGLGFIQLLTDLGQTRAFLQQVEEGAILDLANQDLRDCAKDILALVAGAIKDEETLATLRKHAETLMTFNLQIQALAHFIALEKMLGDALLTDHQDDADKEIYFKLLDQYERYIPLLLKYISTMN